VDAFNFGFIPVDSPPAVVIGRADALQVEREKRVENH
jgi:hypothetical protein